METRPVEPWSKRRKAAIMRASQPAIPNTRRLSLPARSYTKGPFDADVEAAPAVCPRFLDRRVERGPDAARDWLLSLMPLLLSLVALLLPLLLLFEAILVLLLPLL